GCHHPHDAAGATQAPACTDCHTGRLPALHAVAEHRDCARCHDIHEAAPSADRATCTACHAAMVDHEPEATSCKGCHPFQ
ncbi:hypothetical protein L6R52_19570, partial [Myxococcota bacterium]|nr:hypothetical protein [Myxococcota bacterium]